MKLTKFNDTRKSKKTYFFWNHAEKIGYFLIERPVKYSISHVLSFVLQTAGLLASYNRCNHLSTDNSSVSLSVHFPTQECPYLNLGCSLVGFTSFQLNCFQSRSVSVALSRSFFLILNERRNSSCR